MTVVDPLVAELTALRRRLEDLERRTRPAGGGGGGVTDHGALTGLGDDDHPQYLRDVEVVAGTNIAITRPGDGTVSIASTASGGVTDHGALTGLTDDDHPQYLQPAEVVAGANITVTRPLDGTVVIAGPAPTPLVEEVFIGPNTPPTGTEELWYDTDAGSAGPGGPFAFKTSLGTGVDTLSGNIVGIVLTNPIAVGDLVVVRFGSDNLDTGSTLPTFTVTDSGGNTYTVVQQLVSNAGATAAGGVAGGIAVCRATNAVATGGGNSIVVHLAGGSVAAKATYAESFTGGGNTVTAQASNIAANGAVTLSAVSPVAAGDLLLGWAAIESNAVAITGDGDTLNGAWSTIVNVVNAAGGTASTRVQVGGQWKITTAAGNQTYGVGGATADVAGGVLVLSSASVELFAIGGGVLRAKVGGTWVDVVDPDHGHLLGLSDDDHPQYLTSARADALFLTPAEGNAAYSPISHNHDAAYLSPSEVVAGSGITVDTTTTPGSVIVGAAPTASGEWTWETDAMTTDPGVGVMAANSADGTAATALVVTKTSAQGLGAVWLGALTSGDGLVISAATAAAGFLRFVVQGAAVDRTTFWSIPVAPVPVTGTVEPADGTRVRMVAGIGSGGGSTGGISQGDADTRYVNVTGDTMTGSLTINSGAASSSVLTAGRLDVKDMSPGATSYATQRWYHDNNVDHIAASVLSTTTPGLEFTDSRAPSTVLLRLANGEPLTVPNPLGISSGLIVATSRMDAYRLDLRNPTGAGYPTMRWYDTDANDAHFALSNVADAGQLRLAHVNASAVSTTLVDIDAGGNFTLAGSLSGYYLIGRELRSYGGALSGEKFRIGAVGDPVTSVNFDVLYGNETTRLHVADVTLSDATTPVHFTSTRVFGNFIADGPTINFNAKPISYAASTSADWQAVSFLAWTSAVNQYPAVGFHAGGNGSAAIWQWVFSSGTFNARNSINSAFVPIQASAFTVNSQREHKRGIVPVARYVLDLVRRLEVVAYTDEENPPVLAEGKTREDYPPDSFPEPRDQIGLVVEQAWDALGDLAPRVIETEPGTGAPGGYRLHALMAVLVKAVQEMADTIDTLNTRIATLEGI